MTKREAKRLCVKKWVYAAKYGHTKGIGRKYPELANFGANCAYCAKYVCEKCPLAKLWGNPCMKGNTILRKYYDVICPDNYEKAKKYARLMLDAIRKS